MAASSNSETGSGSETKSTPPPFFRIESLCKRLGGHEVLRDVSFDIPAGRTTVILGGSGAGKSVFLKHLNGLLRPDAGRVLVEDEDLAAMDGKSLRAARRRIGVLFQDGALFDSMRVGENVAFPLREAGGTPKAEILARVSAALAEVGLEGEENKMPAALSGGMRKRVALARAMVSEPRCLLCDEPTAGLDPVLSESISQLIRRTTLDHGITTVMVTHDLGAMRLVADRVVFLKDGEVHFAGGLAELEDCDDPDLRAFLDAKAGGG